MVGLAADDFALDTASLKRLIQEKTLGCCFAEMIDGGRAPLRSDSQ